MKVNTFVVIICLSILMSGCKARDQTAYDSVQKSIDRITMMSDFPRSYSQLDWNKMARDFDSLVYDFSASGDYWPVIWLDDSRKNMEQSTFGIYTAIGDVRQGPDVNGGMFHESLNSLGSLFGASLIGINKSDQHGYNFVEMIQNYYNTENGWNIIMNNTCPDIALLGGGYGRDWWYDVFPNVLFYGLANFYPEVGMIEEIQLSIAEQFYKADSVMKENIAYSYFDYQAMEGKNNFICSQEDAVAGHAYVLFSAYKKFDDNRYLNAAISSLKAMEKLEENRFYEILMPFGAYTAARLNAEEGTSFDPSLWIDWSFEPAVGRKGWGVLVGEWNEMDISGLVGSIEHNDGYAFLMNTFDMAWPLVPMVRYDSRYANAIGKWILHASSASRYFYPYEMPDEHQTLPELKEITKGVIAYEGLIHHSDFEDAKDIPAPVAQGDGPNWIEGNPPSSQFSVYGSGHVGIFGSIIQETNIKGILKLDLLATDLYRDKAYPSYLIYNPFEKSQSVELTDHSGFVYDMISKERIQLKKGMIEIPAQSSRVVVYIPEDGERQVKGGKLLIDGVVVDYQFEIL